MSSSTSLASARRRKGVLISETPNMVRINTGFRGRGLMQQAPQQMQKQAPQQQVRSYIQQKQNKEPVTRSFDGIGEIAKFEPTDHIVPVEQSGKIMFGISDIVKIHEKKLVQHENSLTQQKQQMEEMEMQVGLCIEELDQKCETLFAQAGIIEPKAVHTTKAPSEEVQQLRNEVDSLKGRVAAMEMVVADVQYLKQMTLNIQSAQTEMSKSLARTLEYRTTNEVDIMSLDRAEQEALVAKMQFNEELREASSQVADIENAEKEVAEVEGEVAETEVAEVEGEVAETEVAEVETEVAEVEGEVAEVEEEVVEGINFHIGEN